MKTLRIPTMAATAFTASALILGSVSTSHGQITGVPGTPPVMIYKGTASYSVEVYSSGSVKSLPAKYKFKDTVYLIKYNSVLDAINANGSGANVGDSQGATTAAGDAAPTSNQFSLIYLINGRHPLATGPGGDFDLSYDMATPGQNFPGDGGDLDDSFNMAVGPLTFAGTGVPGGRSNSFALMPLLMDTSVNEINGDARFDNRRTQMLGLVGKLDARPKVLRGTSPLAQYGGGGAAPLAAGVFNAGGFAPSSWVGVYSALSVFNDRDRQILQDPYNVANPTGFNNQAGAAMHVITGKWSLKLDAKLTANANNNTRNFASVDGGAAVLAYLQADLVNGAPVRTGALAWANSFGIFVTDPVGDGTKFAGEMAVIEALMGGRRPATWNGAFPYQLNGFNGNFPSTLATILF